MISRKEARRSRKEQLAGFAATDKRRKAAYTEVLKESAVQKRIKVCEGCWQNWYNKTGYGLSDNGLCWFHFIQKPTEGSDDRPACWAAVEPERSPYTG